MIHIIDNFYDNPILVREHILGLDFTADQENYSYYTGAADVTCKVPEHLLMLVQNITQRKISRFYSHARYITYEQQNSSWVHRDAHADVAAMIYLTPNAPLSTGTSFFRHNDKNVMEEHLTNSDSEEFKRETSDITRWTETIRINNIFNRCIVFDTNMYHRSTCNGFGDRKSNSRLFQIVFMGLE